MSERKDGKGATTVSARYVPTDALPSEAPPSERRTWPSLGAWLADPDHYWYPEPEAS